MKLRVRILPQLIAALPAFTTRGALHLALIQSEAQFLLSCAWHRRTMPCHAEAEGWWLGAGAG